MENRIIKFKAKRLDNDEWVEGYYYKECDNTYIIEDRQERSMLNRNEAVLVEPATVCQFTGLKDEEGKEIFEGDLLAEKSFPMYEVGYIDGEFGASYIGENTFIFKLYALSNDCVVCGSKYDRKGGEK